MEIYEKLSIFAEIKKKILRTAAQASSLPFRQTAP
jgi:hypothetical protein